MEIFKFVLTTIVVATGGFIIFVIWAGIIRRVTEWVFKEDK